MRRKLIFLLLSFMVLTGGISVFFTSSNKLFHFGVIESLTYGDNLYDLLIPLSRTITRTVELPASMGDIHGPRRVDVHFYYDEIPYVYVFYSYTEMQITCCGEVGTGYDDCAAWSSDTDKGACLYYWTSNSNWSYFIK